MTMDDNKSVSEEVEKPSIRPSDMLPFFEGAFAESARTIPDDIWALNELQLQDYFKPNTNDFLIRKRLHKLFNDVKAAGVDRIIHTQEIYTDICSRQYFYKNLVKNHFRLAWYFQPIQNYEDLIEDGLYHAIRKVREELLSMPVNEKTAGHIMKALEFFANRHLGPVVQRIEQKSMHLSLKAKEKDVSMDPEQMMQKYLELKQQFTALPTPAQIIEDPE